MGMRWVDRFQPPRPGTLHIEGMGEGGKGARKMLSLYSVQDKRVGGSPDSFWMESQGGEAPSIHCRSEITSLYFGIVVFQVLQAIH